MDSKTRAYQFSLKMIKFIDSLPECMSTRIMARQLLRAGTSIGANIVEAQSGASRRDFTNFFNHSLKSANETKYWLGLLKDTNKVDRGDIDVLIKEVEEIANILASSILTLKGRKKF